MSITGYHGTSVAMGEQILKEKLFQLSRKNTDWLGTGIYFHFEYPDAKNWAMGRHKRNWAVLQVLVDVDMRSDDEYIDFDFGTGKEIYRKTIDELQKIRPDWITESAQENQCLVANFIWKEFPEVKCLAAAFPTIRTRVRLVKDPRRMRREFCVRDNGCIKNVQLLERGDSHAHS